MFAFEELPDSVSSGLAACALTFDSVDAFWRTASGELGHRWWDGGRWSSETRSLGAGLESDPTACVFQPGRIDVFWRDSSGGLGHNWYVDRVWGGGEVLSVQNLLESSPSACSWGPGRIDVFWRDPSGRLVWKYYESGWSADRAFPGVHASAGPGACASGPGRISLFWRLASGELAARAYDRGYTGGNPPGWRDVENLGGTFEGEPAACSWAPGVVDVFVRNASDEIWHRWYDGSWFGWKRREGLTIARPAVASWGDGRIDAFVAGRNDRLWHGYYNGAPVATRAAQVTTVWGFLSSYGGTDKLSRFLNSFPCGWLHANRCSGAMVSPHIFMTASHCGGPGFTSSVQFFRINQFAAPADAASQQLSEPYAARTLAWQDSGIGSGDLQGDTVFWWVEDGSDGVAPGIKYGYQEISPLPVELGARAYSFWQNPALRHDSVLLYSEGDALQKLEGSWIGPATRYNTWTVGGASGSTNIIAEGGHAHRVVGVTQGGEGANRAVPDAADFLREYDADRNVVADAIDYDWIITRPLQDFYLFRFDTPSELARWLTTPITSATADAIGSRAGSLSGRPRLAGRAGMTDGFWYAVGRFRRNQAYRISIAASGAQDGSAVAQSSYVKFRSDRTGHEVRFDFRPMPAAARFVGRVSLGDSDDYRVILGTDAGTTLEVFNLAIVAEGAAFRLGFGTHDERRSWEFAGESRPTAWGTRGAANFGGVVIPPSRTEWGLRNRYLALLADARYRMRFEVSGIPSASASGSGWVRIADLGGAVVPSGESAFLVDPGMGPQLKELIFSTGSGPPKTVMCGANDPIRYIVSDLVIEPA